MTITKEIFQLINYILLQKSNVSKSLEHRNTDFNLLIFTFFLDPWGTYTLSDSFKKKLKLKSCS